MTADRLLDRLEGVQGRGPRWRAICPAHVSKHKTRSLAVMELDDGRLLLHCFRGCTPGEIVRAIGVDLSDLFPSRATDDRAPRVKRPWRASDLIAALKHELTIAWIVLGDVSAGGALTDADRKRAALARTRIIALLAELQHAH